MRLWVALLGLIVSSAPVLAQIGGYGERPGLPEPYWCAFAQGRDSAITRASSRVIASQNDWEMYWRSFTGKHAADVVSAPGGIDWRSEQMIVIHAGRQPKGTFVYVEDINRSDAFYWTVSVVTVRPQERQSNNRRRRVANGNNSGQTCSPYVIIRMSKLGGVPRFAYRTDQANPRRGRPGGDRYDGYENGYRDGGNGYYGPVYTGRPLPPRQPGQGNQNRQGTYEAAGYDGTFAWGPFGWKHPIKNPPKSGGESRDSRSRDRDSSGTDSRH